jgi:hypothetical protein
LPFLIQLIIVSSFRLSSMTSVSSPSSSDTLVMEGVFDGGREAYVGIELRYRTGRWFNDSCAREACVRESLRSFSISNDLRVECVHRDDSAT